MACISPVHKTKILLFMRKPWQPALSPLSSPASTTRHQLQLFNRALSISILCRRNWTIATIYSAASAKSCPTSKISRFLSINKYRHATYALLSRYRSNLPIPKLRKHRKDGVLSAGVLPFHLDGLHWALIAALALFLLFDVFWFIRAFDPIIRHYARFVGSRRSSLLSPDKLLLKNVLQKTSYSGICTTQDLDFLCHMNNVRYMREMDFARFQHFTLSGVGNFLMKFKARSVVSASTIRYRKSVTFLEKFEIETQILCWDASALYMEQRIVADGMAKAVAYYKMHVSIKDMDVNEMMQRVCNSSSPTPPDYIQSWITFNAQSSESLKKERITAAK